MSRNISYVLWLSLAGLVFVSCRPQQFWSRPALPALDNRAGGMQIQQELAYRRYSERADESIRKDDVVRMSFPVKMVGAEALEKAVANPPVRISPAIPFAFQWVSETQGEVRFQEDASPETEYRLTLIPNLVDAAGKVLRIPGWGVRWAPKRFSVKMENRWGDDEDDNDSNTHLPAKPTVRLRFSHPVDADEVARSVTWRDERRGVTGTEVRLVTDEEIGSKTCFDVMPERPLAAGRHFELLVENTCCLNGKVRLAYPYVFALGRTRPMEITTVGAVHQPKEGTFLVVAYNQNIEAGSVPPVPVQTTPEVRIRRVVTRGNEVRVFGDFSRGLRYDVAVTAGTRGWTGYSLEKPEHWKATFPAKRAAVILERSVLTTPAMNGLTVNFVQVNTGVLAWKLAEIPRDLIGTVRTRLNEYRDRSNVDPDTGKETSDLRLDQTELLVPALKLPVVSEGQIAASSGDAEVERTIEFSPGKIAPGVYLLEIAGLANDGRTAGNRALLFVNREFLVWKSTPRALLGRLFDVVSGDPVGRSRIQLLGDDGALLSNIESDDGGNFTVDGKGKELPIAMALVERDGRTSAHPVPLRGHGAYFYRWNGEAERYPEAVGKRQWLFTDRSIYRPGETIKVEGIVRDVDATGELRLPDTGKPVAWVLRRAGTEETLLSGDALMSPTGSWETEIVLPTGVALGRYALTAFGRTCEIKVDEFRAPAFQVEALPEGSGVPNCSHVRVVSNYFHGAPNAKALVRWRAIWTGHVPYVSGEERGISLQTSDYHSPGSPLRRPYWCLTREERETQEAEAKGIMYDGTAVLDASGSVVIESKAMFSAKARYAFVNVRWEISVLAADGQTVTAEANQIIGIKTGQPAICLQTSRKERELELWVDALNQDGVSVSNTPLTVEIFRVDGKSVRELVSRRVVKYRNTSLYTSVFKRDVQARHHELITVEKPGRYVAVATLGDGDDAPRASEEAYVYGPSCAEYAQWDDASVELKTDRDTYRPGDIARVALLAPFGGKCWVTVETDRVLYSKSVDLPANASAIEIPVTTEMHPNAHVSVYLFRPVSEGEAAERIGSCVLRVDRPELDLHVETNLLAEEVEPGSPVGGVVKITGFGKALAGAEVTVFAVDESVLSYGRWTLPDPRQVFFPFVEHQVGTWSGIDEFKQGPVDDPLFQKGFLLGDGGALWRSQYVRSKFRTLAFWQTRLVTDANGEAKFNFNAPDNLTAYRIVAVVHHGADRFGRGQKMLRVARKLQAEPAFPRFVRNGDEVDLRVVLRQRAANVLPVRFKYELEGAELVTPPNNTRDLKQGLPDAVVLRVQVGNEATRLRVRFSVAPTDSADAFLRDDFDVELPVYPPSVVRHESIAGQITNAPLDFTAVVPSLWTKANGSCDLVLSSSPWLPVLEGLPSVLEYPHGCSEQVSARILAYAMMSDLLRSLPDGQDREPEYRKRVGEGMFRLARAQLPEGDLAYWPGGTTPNTFVTIQSAWAVVEAQRAGMKISPALANGLKTALNRIVRKQNGVRAVPPLRAFALMVLSSTEPAAKPQVEAIELYQERDGLGDDGRAYLALALHRFGILPEEKKQLLTELGREPVASVFDFKLFNSERRTRALRFCAGAEIEGRAWTEAERTAQRKALADLMASSRDFSTQENLWLLLAFRALVQVDREHEVLVNGPQPDDAVHSADGLSTGWYARTFPEVAQRWSGITNLQPVARSYFLRAKYWLKETEKRTDRGFRVERCLKNLTAAERVGSSERPYAIGDEVMVTFKVWAERPQSYVAMEESLPAAFETVDPEYFHTTRADQLQSGDDGSSLYLSHWEKRDDRTLWYFDSVEPGPRSYAVLVRVTSSGDFRWPGVTIAPMYDARWSGISDGGVVHVR
ncbi:MAG: alpha-2-macroglobulin family protein [Nibricoccus sp.]